MKTYIQKFVFGYQKLCELLAKKSFLEDTKLLFDSVRNLGICAAILVWSAELYHAVGITNKVLGGMGLILVTGLLFLNFNWTRNSLQTLKITKWNSFINLAFQTVLIICFYGMLSKFL